MTVRASATDKKLAVKKDNPWAKFTTTELERKLAELRKLIDSGMLTDRSLDHQLLKLALSSVSLRNAMAGEKHAKFKNDQGVAEIRIGTKKFSCAGASEPQDHPHIYLDMGPNNTILCPYCATLFRYDDRLGPGEVDPPDCVFLDSNDV